MNHRDLAIEICDGSRTLARSCPRQVLATLQRPVMTRSSTACFSKALHVGTSSSDDQLAHLFKRIGSSNQDFQYKLARVLFEFCFFQMTTRHPSRQRLQRPLIPMQRGYIEVIRCPSAAAVPCGPASVQSYETRHMMQTRPRRRFRRSGA